MPIFRQFSEEATRQIASTVRTVRREFGNETPDRPLPRQILRLAIRVELSTTLSYRGTATAAVLSPAPDDDQTGETLTVTDGLLNSGDSISSGTIAKCDFIGGVWVPTSWSCQ